MAPLWSRSVSSRDAGHLVLAFEGLGQVVGLAADAGSLVLQVLDGLFHGGLEGGIALGLRAFGRLETLLHGLEVFPQGTGDVLERFFGLLLEGFLPLLEKFFRLGR